MQELRSRVEKIRAEQVQQYQKKMIADMVARGENGEKLYIVIIVILKANDRCGRTHLRNFAYLLECFITESHEESKFPINSVYSQTQSTINLNKTRRFPVASL